MAQASPNGNPPQSLQNRVSQNLIARHPRLFTHTNILVLETSTILNWRPAVLTITKGLIKKAKLPLSHKNFAAGSSMILRTTKTREQPH